MICKDCPKRDECDIRRSIEHWAVILDSWASGWYPHARRMVGKRMADLSIALACREALCGKVSDGD